MIKLAESSNIVAYETGNKLYISKRPATWTSVFLFVTGLLAVILLVNGILQLFMAKDATGSSRLGIIFILIAVLCIIIFWKVWLYRKKVNAIPLHQLQTICIFDFESNYLLDAQQNILTPIEQAWFTRKMQISSSSPELIMQWNGGSFNIVKGNPFSGGITGIERVLLSKGVRKK